MILLTPEQTARLESRFLPEKPGPLVGPHVIHTGIGACSVDRWPTPQAVLVETAGNYILLGEVEVPVPTDMKPRIKGFVETSEVFVPLFRAAFSRS